MSVARYSYINAKIRARNAELLSNEQWDAMLGARDMFAALRILDGTGYSDLVREFNADTSPMVIERALQGDFNTVFQEISRDAPESVHSMLIWVQRKYQKENLKTLLRLHAGEADRSMAERVLIPIEPFTVEFLLTLYDSTDLHQLAANIPDEFFKRVIGEAVTVYEETKDLMMLEHAIDAEVYENLFGKAETLSGTDRMHTLKLIGVEVDMINMLTTLRSHLLQLDKTTAKDLLLSKEFHLKREVAQQAIDAPTLEDAVNLLAVGHYAKFVRNAWEAYELRESLRVFEHAFQTQIFKASREAMLGDPFHFGVILGYLNRKWFEIVNLKALMHGKAEKLDPNMIHRTLIL